MTYNVDLFRPAAKNSALVNCAVMRIMQALLPFGPSSQKEEKKKEKNGNHRPTVDRRKTRRELRSPILIY